MTRFALARALALAVPLALLGGAYGSQYIGHLVPCEMCWWQRYPHALAILLAAAAFVRPTRALVALAALAIMASGAIGAFHAGVEYGWWQGLTRCTADLGNGGDFFKDVMAAPLVRCDQAQWALFGISLAGWNALLSLGFGSVILWLTVSNPRR
jgi:disulfide bond formation protein DsbB